MRGSCQIAIDNPIAVSNCSRVCSQGQQFPKGNLPNEPVLPHTLRTFPFSKQTALWTSILLNESSLVAMRFGAKLQSSIYEPWKDSYLNYSKLKNLLYEGQSTDEWGERNESRFVEELDSELEKVESFIANWG